jgi:Eco29kI restriction endonuclease
VPTRADFANVAAVPNTPLPYNPLDRVELGKSVERALLSCDLVSLPPTGPFPGAGVYALYYVGDFGPYRAIAPPARSAGDIPIYVGRASPPGGRSGGGGLRPSTTKPQLYKRLREHAISITRVEEHARHLGHTNIRLADFLCRFLVVDDIWVALGEAVLIGHYQPVWNGFVPGFGIHAPGGGRDKQARSRWDTLHPGRPLAAKRPPGPRTANEIAAEVAERLSNVQAPDLNVTPDAETVEQLMLSGLEDTIEDDTD